MVGKRIGLGFAYREITLTESSEAVFKIINNDGVVCWINQNLVHSILEVGRALKLDEDSFRVYLNKRKNTILLKEPNVGGNGETCLSINNSDDKPINLTYFF